MALTLTLRPQRAVLIADRRWVLARAGDRVTLRSPEGRQVEIFEDKGVEIEPDVVVSLGLPIEDGIRLVFQAPRSVLILREDLVA